MYLEKGFYLSPLEVWRAAGFCQCFEQGQPMHRGGQGVCLRSDAPWMAQSGLAMAVSGVCPLL